MYAKLRVFGKDYFSSKKDPKKTVYVIHGVLLESESVYDNVKEGNKCVIAYTNEKGFNEIPCKKTVVGNIDYKNGFTSFYPYPRVYTEAAENEE